MVCGSVTPTAKRRQRSPAILERGSLCETTIKGLNWGGKVSIRKKGIRIP